MTTKKPIEERLWPKVVKTPDGCWLWTGAKSLGYGYIALGNGKQDLVHRVVYKLLVGPIPANVPLDHLCHSQDESCPGGECIHRRCCNPVHLEICTVGENVLRGRGPTALNAKKTHCPSGHPYSAENTYVTKKGFRMCRTCVNERSRRNQFKRRWGDKKEFADRRLFRYVRDGRVVTNHDF